LIQEFERLVRGVDLLAELHGCPFAPTPLVGSILHPASLDLRRGAVPVVVLDDATVRCSATAVEVFVACSPFPRHEIS
tara:strand:+ start:28518 stop:28751 length:234 start_codon:yes stop_codon:yes gene_type:complete